MRYTLLLILALITQVAHSQIISQLPNISTRGSDDIEIVLSSLDISVLVVENIATTTFEMSLYNDNSRVMEGEFNFPLSNGVTISRFALDVNGEMREGVVVDKEIATQAFESVIRQKIDPGIAEITKGNNFRSRIYPIPSKGYKKAIIAFEQELKVDGDSYIYQLPLNIEHLLQNFSVKVEVVMNRPKVLKSSHPIVNLDFKRAHNSYISEYQKSDISLDKYLAFSIPRQKRVKEVCTYRGAVTSDNYFYININLDQEQRAKPKPTDITILWDVSSSSNNRDIEREITTLTNYLNWMNRGRVQLITFSNIEHDRRSFSLKNGDSRSIIKELRSLNYDGGTNLGAVNLELLEADEILLFTDGVSTFGEFPTYTDRTSITAINSSNIANHNLLEHITNLSNGTYVNALELSEEEINNLLTHQQKRFIKAEFNSEKIKELYPTTGQSISNSFSCSGIMEGATTDIELSFGYGSEITDTRTVTVDNRERRVSNIGERVWAQKKLKSLLIENSIDAIKAHGKQFSLVTPGTSLIVLDNVSDYVRYEIQPPASLQKQYNLLLSQKQQKREEDNKVRFNKICQMFKFDYRWWDTVVDCRDSVMLKRELRKVVEDEIIAFDSDGTTPPPPPPPAVTSQLSVISVVDNDVEFDEETIIAIEPLKKRQRESVAKIEVNVWSSDASYMSDLKAVDSEDIYKEYLTLKAENGDNPSFYFDVSTYMFQKSLREEGLRVISNLAELELESAELLRSLGRKLSENKFYEEAIYIFKEVMKVRSFEPHSYMDLGLTYAEKGDYQKAIENLYVIIEKSWDADIISRFPGIEIIVLHDINTIISQHKRELDISSINSCFIKNMPVDIRVLIDWNADNTDIDLWIADPSGEKCSYSNRDTRIGGRISNDITQGYGPEEFRLRYAPDGKYSIDVKFYGSRSQKLLENVTVRAYVFTNYGLENEHKEVLTLQLEPSKSGVFNVGEIEFSKK